MSGLVVIGVTVAGATVVALARRGGTRLVSSRSVGRPRPPETGA